MDTNTKLVWLVVVALIVGGFVGYALVSRNPDSTPSVANTLTKSPEKQVALYTAMRKLWADHVFWTREYIIAAVDGTPDAQQAAARLMKNQEDIGNAVAAYYGASAGEQLTSLLKQHISIATEIVSAAKANDQNKLQDANTRWQDNANQVTAFLAGANPNWPKATLEDFMNTHLKTTADELNARINKQYDKDVMAFDAVFDHIMNMSDALSAGIIKQFPDKF
jgi:hypothetical protein